MRLVFCIRAGNTKQEINLTWPNFLHLVTLRNTRVRLIVYLVMHQMKYGKIEQCNNILRFAHVRAERLSKKRKPRLCFPR